MARAQETLLLLLHWSSSPTLTTYITTYINKQTDQTTTLCVQEVEIYLERWEVLGALVDVCARA